MTAGFAQRTTGRSARIKGMKTSGKYLDKWAVLDQIGFQPHPGQLKIMESTARNRVASCGRRFGKSVIGGNELVPEAFVTYGMKNQLLDLGKRREFWIVGPEYTDAEKEFRVLYNQLRRLDVPFDKPGTYNDPNGGNFHISLWEGAFQVHGKSAKYPDTLVGEGLSGAILAEAAKLKERVWTKYVSPTLKDFKGWSLMTSTPEGKNWFYDYWQKGQDPRNAGAWESWRMPAWYNPWVYETPTSNKDVRKMQEVMNIPANAQMSMREIADQYGLVIDDEVLISLNDTTVEAFNQEYGADFTEFVGRVFKEFDEEVHVTDLKFNPTWSTFAGVDYGFSTSPNVWLLIQVGPFNEVHVLDEFYEHGLTAVEFADEIQARGLCPAGLRTFYPDPALPGDTRILENKLRVRASGGTGGELRYRIDAIRDALKESPLHVERGHSDRRPQLLIDRRCKMTIHEFNEYRYPDKRADGQITKAQESPMKKDDHTPEALGRFFKGYFGTPQDTAARRQTKAKFRR